MLPRAPLAAEPPARVRSIDGCWLGRRNTSERDAQADAARGRERRLEPAEGGKRQQDCGRDGAAEEAGEGVDREGAADPRLGDAVGEDGIVGGVIDAVGKAGQDRGRQQPWIGGDEGNGEERQPAQDQPGDEHRPRTDAVDEKARRRLRQAGDDVEGGERQPEIEEADVEPLLEQRQQHRQDHDVEMADEVRRRDRQQGLRLAAGGGDAGQALGGVGSHRTFGWARISPRHVSRHGPERYELADGLGCPTRLTCWRPAIRGVSR